MYCFAGFFSNVSNLTCHQTPVGMTSVFMHHNEDIFPDSYNFVPERWIDPEHRKYLEKYMVSFTKGSRQCVGMKYVILPK